MLKSLAMLQPLPTRLTGEIDAEVSTEVFLIALDGVTVHALQEATQAILRGKLGHAFHPSPPEFRLLCNQMMQPVYDELTKERRLEQEAELNPEPIVLEPGWRERCAVRLKAFYDENALASDAKPVPAPQPPTIHDYSHEPIEITPALLRNLEQHKED